MGCFRLKSVRCDDMKLKSLLWVCLLLMALCACSDNVVEKQYTIYKEDGKTYMQLPPNGNKNEHIRVETNQHSMDISVDYPRFETVAEMKEKILSGEIPEESLSGLRARTDEKNMLEICDPDNLFDLLLPNDLEYEYIEWYGASYKFVLDSRNLTGHVYFCDESRYTKAYDEEFSYYTTFDGVNILEDNTVADRNARVIHYTNGTGEYMNISYSVPTETGKVCVSERYCLMHYFGGIDESESVPFSVRIFGDEGDRYFYGFFVRFAERPSQEWFASFTLDPV